MKAKILVYALLARILATIYVAEMQPTKIPRIGYLTLRSSPNANDQAFPAGLRALGYIEGGNIITS
jgi:hypothetical protein